MPPTTSGPDRCAHRRSGAEHQQPQQRHPHRGRDVHGPVPRPRHDVRHDVAARACRRTRGARPTPAARTSISTPCYGDGPAARRSSTSLRDRAKLRVESGGILEDLPRDGDGGQSSPTRATTRTSIIAGLQAAMLLVHNTVVDGVRHGGTRRIDTRSAFAEARRLRDLALPVDHPARVPAAVRRPAHGGRVLADGPRFYRPQAGPRLHPGGVPDGLPHRPQHGAAVVPRQLHRQGRRAVLRDHLRSVAGGAGTDPSDVRGGVRAARRFVGWTTFFRFPGLEADMRPNKRIDTKLSTPLFDLPLGAIASGQPPTSLAQRNLLRHLTWRLPSGQINRAGDGRAGAGARAARRAGGRAPALREVDAAVVLRAARGRRDGRRAANSGRSAAASWPRCSSGCCARDPDSFLHAGSRRFQPSLGPAPGRVSG